MISLTRVKLALRSAIVETSAGSYFISMGIALLVLSLFVFLEWQDEFGATVEVTHEALIAAFFLLGFFPAFGISSSYYVQRFKDAGRAEDLLMMPLSPRERFSTGLLYSWVFVPTITFLPLLLIAVLVYLVVPPSISLPTMGLYLLPSFFTTLSIYYILSLFWFLPSIAYPRYMILIVIGLVGVTVGATILMHEVLPDPGFVHTIDASIFEDPGVVGMRRFAAYSEATPAEIYDFSTYTSAENNNVPWQQIILAAPFLLLAAYRALNQQQA